MKPNMYPIISMLDDVILIQKDNKGISGAFSQDVTDPNDITTPVEIPKIIHMIWLGSSPPKSVSKIFDSWLEHHWDWRFFFWNDANQEFIWEKFASQHSQEFSSIKALYDELTIPAYKADVLRLVVLSLYGGVYVDSDMLCLRSIESISRGCSGFTSLAHTHLNNGLFGAIPNSAWILDMIRSISKYKDYLLGPRVMTEATWSHPEIRIFHELTFNPLKYDDPKLVELRESLNGCLPLSQILNSPLCNKHREFSYALHLWNYSWNK